MLQGGRTPSTAHVISPRAAVAALSCTHAGVVVIDARNPSLVALDRVAGAVAFELASVPSLHGRTALVYDAGSSGLLPPHSRAARAVASLLAAHPFDARVCLVAGGLPALRATAPRLVVCAPRSAAEVDRLRTKLAGMRGAPGWARAALESLIDAARPAAAVLDWLDVGSDSDARSLPTMRARGYTHVLAVGEELRVNFPADFEYFLIPALDVASYRIIGVFPLVVHFLRKVRARAEAGEKVRVLVHCFAGMSRSVAAVAAFFAAEGVPVETGLRHIASHRVGAAPNHGFLTQLSEWEMQLRGPKPPVAGPLTSKLDIPVCCGLNSGASSSCGLKSAMQTRRPSELERDILKECQQEPEEREMDCRSMSPVTPDVDERHSVSETKSKVGVKDANAKVWTETMCGSEDREGGEYSSGTYSASNTKVWTASLRGSEDREDAGAAYVPAKKGCDVRLFKKTPILKDPRSPGLRPDAPYELMEYCGDDSGTLEDLKHKMSEG